MADDILVNQKLFNQDEVNNFTAKNNFAEAAKILFNNQQQNWEMLKKGAASLSSVETKTFPFDGFRIKVQFNPGRITSTSAKVDAKSIKERKCFLCVENLPDEQKGILYEDEFLILCNPFPIFPEHFTLSSISHKPQSIKENFHSFLSFAKNLSKYYTVFYNGPRCGASAPDHLHFQAGNKFFMPIDNDFHQIKNESGTIIFENEKFSTAAVDDGLRKFISIETPDAEEACRCFNYVYDSFKELSGLNDEPMMNIVSTFEEEFGWRILIFLREKHRPQSYFAEGDENLLLSPASVDVGGVCITPLEKDFQKISADNLKSIFREVFISEDKLSDLSARIKNQF